MHKTPTRSIVLRELRLNNLRQQTLAQIAGVKRSTIASCISRLREQGFRIMAEATETSGDPKYILISEPDDVAGAA